MQISSVEFESRSRIKSLLQICCEVCLDKRRYNGCSIRTRPLSCGAGNVPSKPVSLELFSQYARCRYTINRKFDEKLLIKISRFDKDFGLRASIRNSLELIIARANF